MASRNGKANEAIFVVADLAAEQGGNCELTEKDKIIESNNGVKIIGYTDFPSRMAAQSSTLIQQISAICWMT